MSRERSIVIFHNFKKCAFISRRAATRFRSSPEFQSFLRKRRDAPSTSEILSLRKISHPFYDNRLGPAARVWKDEWLRERHFS